MTLRISYDHQVFSWQTYGGISRYYYEIANRIASMGNSVEIFAPFFVNEYIKNGRQIHPCGVKIPFLRNISPQVLKIINSTLACLLIKHSRNIDILHETYYSLLDWCPKSAKRVITVYDMIHDKFPEHFSSWNKTRHIKENAIRRADHVICISENTRRDLLTILNIPEDKTSVVHLGYSLNFEKTVSHQSDKKMPFILYVGSRGGWKNFDRLLHAYANSTFLNDECSLICFGGGGFSAHELSLMKSLKISEENIKYISGTDETLAHLYASASLFVFPSLYEGFGIPPLEAMSFGCPVACSNTSSLPEVVGNAAELFDPADTSSIRSALESVLTCPGKAKILVERGHERVQHFSWEKCAYDTLNVYTKILGLN